MLLAGSVALFPGTGASGFGTIATGGQNREHERITRAAVACPEGDDDTCFQARSISQLAGDGKQFGAVGSPDLTESLNPAAHCDDADFLNDGDVQTAAGYPRTRDQATTRLHECIDHLRDRFREAVTDADGLLDANGDIAGAEVDLGNDCVPGAAAERRAKCATLEAFGRALHGAQDFYSHSNWADAADPSRPAGPENPPGLNLPAPSALFDLRGTGTPAIPDGLTTGCFVVPDQPAGVAKCRNRVTHAALNKDTGLVDPATGATSDPTTPRGQVGDNFAKAVTGAIVETRRQWDDLRDALRTTYGRNAGDKMACALTHDDPVNDCRRRNATMLAVVAAGILLLGGAAVARWLIVRRRPRADRT
ncbi:CinY protein [Actinoplanes sp. TBRC 11911]|nr:CinY protein [Actinoplanes sp. TBRC 11911]